MKHKKEPQFENTKVCVWLETTKKSVALDKKTTFNDKKVSWHLKSKENESTLNVKRNIVLTKQY